VTTKKAMLAGRYRLLGPAGHGPAGTVWRAKDELLDRFVAVRRLYPGCPFDAAHADRVRARAIREARVAIRLRHPHALVVHDVFEENMTPYLVTEYLAARTLTELVEQHRSLSSGQVAVLGAQLASALAAAHADGILHRRISPDNVLVTPAGTAKIADFGLGTGDTNAFAAPEAIRGTGAGHPADVFSLGAILYTALEGQPPSGVVPPRTRGPVLDAVLSLLHHEPADRPTMAEAERLLTALTTPRPATPARKTKARVRVLVTRTLLVVAAGAAVTSIIARRSSARSSPSS